MNTMETPSLTHLPNTPKRRSLRRLSQAVLDKLSSTTSTSELIDSDSLTWEIRRRLTFRSTGVRRLSILSQSGSYKLSSSQSGQKRKTEDPVEQVTLSRKRKPLPNDEENSIVQGSVDVSTSSNRSESSNCQSTVALTKRKRAQHSNSVGRTASTSSRNSNSKVRVVKKTSSCKSNRPLRSSVRNSPIKKLDQKKTTRGTSIRKKMSVKKTHPNFDLNETTQKIIQPQSAVSKESLKKKTTQDPSLKTKQVQLEDDDDRSRRMSFDEYQLLEHKKKLEKELVFKTYREKRAEFIQCDEMTN